MTTKTFRTRKARKGIVGIEAAIVLIAFVIVAAALAFVVLNMGFYTTQKSKETMKTGLEEATSALEVDGSVIGAVDKGTEAVWAIAIPIKLSSGRSPVDLTKVAITITTENKTVYLTVNEETPQTKTDLSDSEIRDVFDILKSENKKFLFIEYVGDGDDLVEVNEKWVLAIALNETLGYKLEAYSTITVEIKPATGAPLTVERMIPAQLSNDRVVLT